MKDKVQFLTDILITRLRYIERWDSVSVQRKNKKEIEVTWYNEGTAGFFERITYPLSAIDDVIRKQKYKLFRDIPDSEMDVYKEVIRK